TAWTRMACRSWTVAAVVAHLRKACSGVYRLWKAPMAPCHTDPWCTPACSRAGDWRFPPHLVTLHVSVPHSTHRAWCPCRAQPPLAPSVPHHQLPCVGLRRAPALGLCAATWTPPLVPARAPGAAGLHGSAVTE